MFKYTKLCMVLLLLTNSLQATIWWDITKTSLVAGAIAGALSRHVLEKINEYEIEKKSYKEKIVSYPLVVAHFDCGKLYVNSVYKLDFSEDKFFGSLETAVKNKLKEIYKYTNDDRILAWAYDQKYKGNGPVPQEAKISLIGTKQQEQRFARSKKELYFCKANIEFFEKNEMVASKEIDRCIYLKLLENGAHYLAFKEKNPKPSFKKFILGNQLQNSITIGGLTAGFVWILGAIFNLKNAVYTNK